MTDQEFEAWLDEWARKYAAENQHYHETDGVPVDDVCRDAARAAWARAQDENAAYWKNQCIEAMKLDEKQHKALKQRSDKLADALRLWHKIDWFHRAEAECVASELIGPRDEVQEAEIKTAEVLKDYRGEAND